jgi:hypothetical protein
MANFMDSLKSLTSLGSSGPTAITGKIQQAATSALTSTMGQQGAQIQKGLEKAENLIIADRIITYSLYGLSAAAALGIFLIQLKTYKHVYGKRPAAANPRRRRRRRA